MKIIKVESCHDCPYRYSYKDDDDFSVFVSYYIGCSKQKNKEYYYHFDERDDESYNEMISTCPLPDTEEKP